MSRKSLTTHLISRVRKWLNNYSMDNGLQVDIVSLLPQLMLPLYIDVHVPCPHFQRKMIQLAAIIQALKHLIKQKLQC